MERDIVKDVLDNQIIDRHKQKMGKVDGIIMELREGKPPRLAYIEVGGTVLASRLHPRLGEWAEKLARKFGEGGMPYRIAYAKIKDVGIDVELDEELEKTSIGALERWLSKNVIGRIPGSG
ncbi:MAG TPA: hypothetical protein VGE45_05090 [Chloroflexia bacterium]|jgi:hypothetical protein